MTEPPGAFRTPPARDVERETRDALAEAAGYKLSEWERGFVFSVTKRFRARKRLTDNQAIKLYDILKKYRGF